jgi:uncharacterized protein YkwD
MFQATFAQTINKVQAQQAFEYLNTFRQNPSEEKNKIGLYEEEFEPRPALVWNEILAKVAEERAIDMAQNNYFSHADKRGVKVNVKIHKAGYKIDKFYLDKTLNSFESIQAGAEGGVAAIIDLIIDEGVKSLGHRKHLLGIDSGKGFPKKSTLVDCGIGYVYGTEDSKYSSYVVVIIAKHGE